MSKADLVPNFADRRSFLKHSALMSAGLCGLGGEMLHPESAVAASDPAGLDIIGPKPGYTPQVGTFVSMLTWMREANGVITATKGLTQADLDYLFDPKDKNIRAPDIDHLSLRQENKNKKT